MSDHRNRCQRCNELLKPGTEVWLWLDQRTNSYSADDDERPEYSQGGFPFGKACSKSALKAHRKAKETGVSI